MKNWIKNKLLWSTAYLLFFPLTWWNKRAVRKVYGSTEGYDYKSAVNLDVFANSEFKTLLNRKLLTPNSNHHFGHKKETISSVLGKNSRDKTLSEKGEKLRKFVDKMDKSVPNHCEHWINKRIKHQEKNFEKFFKP